VTSREGSRLVAQVDDSRLPPGTYELRSRAFDQAGNEASTGSRYDGEPMILRLPIRFESLLTAGVAQERVIRKRIGRRGHRRLVKRRVRRLVPAARVHLRQRVRIFGRLANADGQPIADATIYVYSRSLLIAESLAGVATTDGDGRFVYVARGSATRTLRFLYGGTRLALPTAREVTLRVPAVSTLRANRRRARNGQSVSFVGRVHSLPIPLTGKLIEIQAHFRGRWRTFSTVRTDSNGRWRFRYRFGGTVGRVRYRFRALLPAEGGYPFETGRSRVVNVTVRGP
jgi:protocatechuate 3,4-dioxygenase beta subunit